MKKNVRLGSVSLTGDRDDYSFDALVLICISAGETIVGKVLR